MQERGLSPYTVQGKVRALKAFASWLFTEGYTTDHILSNLKMPKASQNLIIPPNYAIPKLIWRHAFHAKKSE